MAKKPINYTSRDFETIKADLVNYAKRYYPSTFQDFNEASFGALMMDLVAYIGDQLSFYVDYQANESFLETALERGNIVRLAKQLGYKMPGAAKSTGEVSFFVEVPSSSATLGPDTSYIPILRRGTTLTSDGGAVYTLTENVDFTDPNNEITVSKVNSTNGVPLNFAIKAFGKIVSGEQYTESVSVGNYERFLRVRVPRTQVSEVLSVTDQEGNDYYEVDYLSQDVIFKEVPNFGSDRVAIPFKLRAVPAPRRYIVEHDDEGNTYIQFGYGSAENLTTDVIADPADVVLKVTGRNYVTDETFDPSNLNESDKFGVVPTNTNLFITFTANSGPNINAPVGTINSLGNTSFSFQDETSLDSSLLGAVIGSVEVNNASPILGDTAPLSAQEIRTRAFATFATQNRAVSRSDYINMSYRMPSKFGRIKRVNIVQDQTSFKRNLNMYVLSENSSGNFVAPNETLKNNLKEWLEPRRMINDSIDILDGKIINYGIRFEVLADLDVNRFALVDACINELIAKNINIKLNIGEAVYISDIYKILNDVPGVTDTINVELVNKVGGRYSNFVYNIRRNLSDDGRYLKIPENSVAEVLFPNLDIIGVVK
jgi:hypothetical protein